MKGIVTVEVVTKTGAPLVTIASNPLTIYQRKDGSFFFMDERKRVTVTQRSTGQFHLRLVNP